LHQAFPDKICRWTHRPKKAQITHEKTQNLENEPLKTEKARSSQSLKSKNVSVKKAENEN